MKGYLANIYARVTITLTPNSPPPPTHTTLPLNQTIVGPHSFHTNTVIPSINHMHTISCKNPILLLLWLILVFVSLYNSDSQDRNSQTYILNITSGPPKHWVVDILYQRPNI